MQPIATRARTAPPGRAGRNPLHDRSTSEESGDAQRRDRVNQRFSAAHPLHPSHPIPLVGGNKEKNAMKRVLWLSALALLVSAGTVHAQDVRYNFDKTANFAGFKTYKWVAIKGASQLSDLADRQVKAAIDAELAKKGLTKTDDDKADLLIGYQPGVNKEKEYTSFDSGYGYGPGWHGGGWYGGGGGGMSTGSTSTIYIGQLAVD